MPSGKTHDRLTLNTSKLLWPSTLVASLSTSHFTPGAIGTALISSSILALACAVSGIWLSPDVDSMGYLKHRYGSLRLLWMPYYRLCRMTGNYRVRGVGTHRSYLSHTPIVGSASRASYLILPPLLFALLAGLEPGAIAHFVQAHPRQVLAIAIGLEVGAAVHYLADLLWSEGR